MPLARFISTEGPYLEAHFEIDGTHLCVMDRFSISDALIPDVGQEVELEFDCLLDSDESWEQIFSGNPEKRVGLKQISGWSYRALGKIVSINPVIVDCGILSVEGIVSINHPKVVGESVAFTISRLAADVHTS